MSSDDATYSLLSKTTVYGLEAIAGFQLVDIPEFDLSERGREFAQRSLQCQKMFVDTVNDWLSNRVTEYSLDLRFYSDPVTQRITCFLLIRLLLGTQDPLQAEAVGQALDEIERMLPEGYNFVRLEQAQLDAVLTVPAQATGYEIRRNCQLIPAGNFDGLYKTKAILAKPGSVYVKQTSTNGTQSTLGYDPDFTFLVPVMRYLYAGEALNWFNLFRLMQEAKTVVQVRVLLSREPLFNYDKALSSQFYGLVRTTYRQNTIIANDEADSRLESLQKFMHNDWLHAIQMQVLSTSDLVASSVASALANQITNSEAQALQILPWSDRAAFIESWQHSRPLYRPFEQAVKRWNADADPFLERFQYLYAPNEISNVFRLPMANPEGLSGFMSRPVKPFYELSVTAEANEPFISLGKLLTSGSNGQIDYESLHNFTILVRNLVKHGLIAGVPGSGKTNTILNFIAGLISHGIPFLLVEPIKSEYLTQLGPLLKQAKQPLLYFQFSRPWLTNGQPDPTFFRFNPLIPPRGITLTQHLSYMMNCIMAAFPMFGIAPLVLEDCLTEFYKLREIIDPINGMTRRGPGLKESSFFQAIESPGYIVRRKLGDQTEVETNNDTVTMKVFSKFIGKYLSDNASLYDSKVRDELDGVLNRRFMRFTKGQLGQVLSPENWRPPGQGYSTIPDNMALLLNQPCILDLDGLARNEDKALMMAFVLTYLFEVRLLRKSHDPANPLHVTIIEEAHRLLSQSSVKSAGGGEHSSQTANGATTAINLFVDILAEIRAKNEGIFLVEQSPVKIISDAVKQTGLKIMHRLPSQTDRDFLGETMNMDELQRRYAITLRPGEAIVFDEQWHKPLLVQMPYFKSTN